MRYVKRLKPVQSKLLDAAAQAMENAHNPYSHYYVGAAVLADGNRIFKGCNFENAAFNDSIHAEMAAISAANTAGYRRIRAIAVISREKNGKTKVPATPCGICRQIIFESSRRSGIDVEVIMSNTDRSKIAVMRISQLLPFAFVF